MEPEWSACGGLTARGDPHFRQPPAIAVGHLAAHRRWEPAVKFRVFGVLEVLDSGRPVQIGAKKERALLAELVLRANQIVSRERLTEVVWASVHRPPPSPPTAAARLRDRRRQPLAQSRPHLVYRVERRLGGAAEPGEPAIFGDRAGARLTGLRA